MPDITNKDVFAPLEAHIRSEEYTDIDLLNLIGNFIDIAPNVARALVKHAVDYMTEHADQDIQYTDAVVAAYYRTFFSPEHAGKYGTDHMVHDKPALRTFAQFAINPASVTEIPDVLAAQSYPSH